VALRLELNLERGEIAFDGGSLSALPSSTSAARTSGSILPFMLLALALRFSRISSHSRLSAW
jgi:hypothetical protein